MSNIIIHTQDHIRFIVEDEIIFCKSDNSYTYVHLSTGEQVLISKSLSKFASELNQNRFVRVNQSYLVNIRFIKSIDKRKKCLELQSKYSIKFTITIKELLSAIGQDYAHS